MVAFKCKMCGGTVIYDQGATIGTCENCGTQQTLPRVDDDRRANLYDRAGHFRRNNEYDKAISLYEQILNEDRTDAEAYWSLVLCKYGIEYVEDPYTRKRVPTMNRTQYTSIFADEDYKEALKYADSLQRGIYEEEAKTIDSIQKGILAISAKEEPFDVFICYKETDNNGRRTVDSVLANEIYSYLTREGLKVFFSRITLEDKLGTAYEPYIFAALNSAKVMIVVGTRAEYFSAPWVKNEWSRYLAIIRKDHDKKLIPAYRDMDPYDLPDEFSHLQALDMGKLGFIQDLFVVIERSVGKKNAEEQPVAKETVRSQATSSSQKSKKETGVQALLKRAEIYLEDGEFSFADRYYDRVLAQDKNNADAYLGKLMVSIQAKKKSEIILCNKPIDDNKYYKKVIELGSTSLVEELREYAEEIREELEFQRKESVLNGVSDGLQANKVFLAQNTEEKALVQVTQWTKDAKLNLETIRGYKNADSLNSEIDRLIKRVREIRWERRYEEAKDTMRVRTIQAYNAAIRILNDIREWKDSKELIDQCNEAIESYRASNRNHIKQWRIIIGILLVIYSIYFCVSYEGSNPVLYFLVIVFDIFAILLLRLKETLWSRRVETGGDASSEEKETEKNLGIALLIVGLIVILMTATSKTPDTLP